MISPRKYVLHDNDRVYLDNKEVLTEYQCAYCGEEVLPKEVFLLHGRIINPEGASVTLHDLDGTAVYLHHEHAADYFTRKLTGVL